MKIKSHPKTVVDFESNLKNVKKKQKALLKKILK